MIVFDLKCDSGHVFEAWFRSSSDFDSQKQSGFLACPHCGSHDVAKAPMAPNVGAKSNQKSEAPKRPVSNVPSPTDLPADVPAVPAQETSVLPNAEMVEKAQSLIEEFRKTVENNCDNVGTDFAEEARKIHYGEAEERGIYGESTAEETQELLDEGIDILPMPSPRRTDA